MPATVFLCLCLRLCDCTNNTDIGRQDSIILNIATSNAYLTWFKQVNLMCIMKLRSQCRQRQCSNLCLHSPDLVLGLLLYRDNMYMKSNLTKDVVSHDYKLAVLY